MRSASIRALCIACPAFVGACATTAPSTPAEESSPFSFVAFGELSNRRTQFFDEDHDASFALLDARLEYWLPPGKDSLSWGPYVRFASIASSSDEAFENFYGALPGAGLQVYPFSATGGILGPMRLFAEYDNVRFEGDENAWRPDEQVRGGLEYWRANGVNDPLVSNWYELWLGSIWQSSNEFDDAYDTLVNALSLRIGHRFSEGGLGAQLTPYALVEAIKTDNERYYWENRAIAGGGLRWAPPDDWLVDLGLERFAVFVEYLEIVDYLEDEAPTSVPEDDWRIGLSFSFGEWFK